MHAMHTMPAKHRAIIFAWVLLIGLGTVVIACAPTPTPRPAPVSPTAPLLEPTTYRPPDAAWSPTALPPAVQDTPTLTKTPRPTRTATPTSQYSPTPTPAQTATPLPANMISPTQVIRGVSDAPAPFDITLPADWQAHFYELGVLPPDGQEMPVKVAFYNGGTPSHAAVVTVLWDYATIYREIWRDGIELVSVVFDPSCQFNLIDVEPQPYTVGIHYADGLRYTVTNCETEPDVRGWLVGYRRGETNYLFYVRITPIEGAEDDAAFVQSILNSIRFPDEP
ncbi:MAG: hypothetical protein JXB47_17500 [Anaerolineae bacterium]|nr:hypothetical protein [Anaerolineae bacterium]